MRTMYSDKMSWTNELVLHSTAGPAWDHLTKRPRLVLGEIGAHPGARMCSTVEDFAGAPLHTITDSEKLLDRRKGTDGTREEEAPKTGGIL